MLTGNFFKGKWEKAEVIRETIHVKGRDKPVAHEVLKTRHGPIISPLLPADAGGGSPTPSPLSGVPMTRATWRPPSMPSMQREAGRILRRPPRNGASRPSIWPMPTAKEILDTFWAAGSLSELSKMAWAPFPGGPVNTSGPDIFPPKRSRFS